MPPLPGPPGIRVTYTTVRVGYRSTTCFFLSTPCTLAREATRERERERILSEMMRREFGDDP
jgi:hypothetical protein